MDGPAPALVNAVENALGVRFQSIPILPEDIFDALVNEKQPEVAPVSGRGNG